MLPGDAGYDQARQAWNLAVDQQPALIVVARSADDVAAAVQYAKQVDLPVAVQATGHGLKRPADGAPRTHTRDAYSLENYHWLIRLKATYDPNNRFDHAFNIPSAAPLRFPEQMRKAA